MVAVAPNDSACRLWCAAIPAVAMTALSCRPPSREALCSCNVTGMSLVEPRGQQLARMGPPASIGSISPVSRLTLPAITWVCAALKPTPLPLASVTQAERSIFAPSGDKVAI
jgi:hypothetical protein